MLTLPGQVADVACLGNGQEEGPGVATTDASEHSEDRSTGTSSEPTGVDRDELRAHRVRAGA